MHLLTAAKRTTTGKGMDGDNTLTTYTTPAHHATQTNLLQSTPLRPAFKENSDGAVTMSLS